MHRIDILQEIVKTAKVKTYLEIGVATGSALYKIRCSKKFAVDPNMTIHPKLKHFLRNPYNIFNQCFHMTSDEFFQQHENLLEKHRLDLVFIDGLHTFTQCLADIMNSLKFLQKNGIIVIDDCNPKTESNARPTSSHDEAFRINSTEWDGAWMGDVWKTIVYLRSLREDLKVFVLDCDDGVGILTKGHSTLPRLPFCEEEIKQLSDQDLARSRETFLNLKPLEYFWEDFIPTLR